ncbi:hypothetical protein PV328_009740 [Microctonus aethiopoides]|uniref:Neurotransmitter-gated ion-channel ligand-binding domain-containing protein n=1 Tax=Microctonus aethiopoides TaxID=144406 RepID=A0AA39C6R0_9HYME|nr:hypothetical protein PV328_009740 [Microctonus aethiopoides]
MVCGTRCANGTRKECSKIMNLKYNMNPASNIINQPDDISGATSSSTSTRRRQSLGCNDIESKSVTLRLKRHLFCDYDPSIRPITGIHSQLSVKVAFMPKFVEFNEHSNSLEFHTWLILTWDDAFLHWNPEDYENIEEYHVKSEEIWVPDFSVFNSGDLSVDQSGIGSTSCILLHNGTIQCAAARVYTTHCPADFANWPYDKHNCTLHFGSWMHFSDEMNFDIGSDSIMMDGFVQNHEWEVEVGQLSKFSELYHSEVDAMIFLNVILQRRPTRNSVIFITPAIILSTLTLTVLWLDSRSIERMAVSCCNFVCHLFCIFDLHWYLPSNGAISCPKILIFYEISICLAAFTLIFTSIIRKIDAITVPPPRWVASMTAQVLNSPASQYLGIHFLERKMQTSLPDDAENIEQLTTNKDQVWRECVIVLEWLGFIGTQFLWGVWQNYTDFYIAKNIAQFITASAFINVYANECNLIEDKSPSLQLFRHLFCDYESSERPTRDPKNTTVLTTILIPKMIKFMDYSNTLLLHTWMYLSWDDEHLQWEASDFNGIDSIWIQSHNIWTPDLAIQNAASADSIELGLPNTYCIVSRNGGVVCVPPVLFSTRCNADYNFWPFDRQNCSLELSSWSYNDNEISFKDNKLDIFMIHYAQNSEWNVISVETGFIKKKSNYMTYEDFPTVVAHFVLQRADNQLWRVFGTPSIILMAMTLTTLWLDPKSNERLLLGCVNFFCHFLCIGNLHWIVPQSNAIPKILMFYYNSLMLAVVALILTCVLKQILDAKVSPPPWISSSVSMILSSKVGQILLLSILDPKASAWLEESADDNSDLVNSQTPKKSTWAYVTIILGWISFIMSEFVNVLTEKCNYVENQSHHLELSRHLFCDYDGSERPVENFMNATNVSLYISPSFVQFDESTNILKSYCWFVIEWTDEFLKWKKEDFHGIKKLTLRNQDVWTPSIYVENAENINKILLDVYKSGCELVESGIITCVPEILFETKCDVDYTYWPFYKPHCKIQLSSWSYGSNEIHFNEKSAIILDRYIPHNEWKLVNISSSSENIKSRYMTHETFPTVTSRFSLQRSRVHIWSMCGTPALILAVMTLTTLWLDPKSNERLMIAYMNLICHLLCIRILHWFMPHSDTVPNILKFYIYSIILTVLALIFTYQMRRIVNSKSLPPLWISSFASMIMSSKLGRILSLSILDPKTSMRLEEDTDDSSILVHRQTNENSSLVEITTIFGWLSFISFLFILISNSVVMVHAKFVSVK